MRRLDTRSTAHTLNTSCARRRAVVDRDGRVDPNAQERHQLYNSRAWRALRKQQLIDHPLCRVCLQAGIMNPAQVVDHVLGHHRADWRDRFMDQSRLQSLCLSCHSSKTRDEQLAGGATRGGVDRNSCDVSVQTAAHPTREFCHVDGNTPNRAQGESGSRRTPS
jgi:hypothetical protein